MNEQHLETKNLPQTVDYAFEDFIRTFEDFKQTNDQRLDQIEQRMSADVLTTEKLDRISNAMDEQKAIVDDLILKQERPVLENSYQVPSKETKHQSAFESYMRHGEQTNLRQIEAKALSISSDPDGGYLVPEQTETTIMRSLKDISPIRAISGVRQVSSSTYKKPFTISGPGTGWVGETSPRPETSTPTLAELTFPTMELYAMPAATSSLLEDSAVNIDQWIAEEVNLAFAEQEGQAFVDGTGTNQPRGFLNYTKVDNSTWTWGNIGYIPTGNAGGFNASNQSDVLIDLIYSIKSGYRANAHWVMNRSTQSEIRKIKDADGNYIWRPGDKADGASTLMNIPIAESEDMPDIATDSYSIAFGDFKRGYLIVDRQGIRVLRDPYSSKPYILFYTTKRVGGGIQDFEAIKLLKFGTS